MSNKLLLEVQAILGNETPCTPVVPTLATTTKRKPLGVKLTANSLEALKACANFSLKLSALKETAASARSLRLDQERTLQQAIHLVEAELDLRRQHANALHLQIKTLAKKKIEVLSDAVNFAKQTEMVDRDASSASSKSGPSRGRLQDVPKKQATTDSTRFEITPSKMNIGESRGLSPGGRAWAKVRSRLLGSATMAHETGQNPQKRFACGPLTKSTAEKYSTLHSPTSMS